MNSLHLLLPAAAYLIGSIPFGLLLSRRSGIDIRQHGSGNIGATNVSRLVGKKIGLLTLLLDAAKGFLPMLAAGLLLGGDDPSRDLITAFCGAAAVTGHMFPVFLRFKGGKGVATALGIFLYLAPKALLVSVAIFSAVTAPTGFVSLGSLLGAVAMLPSLYFFDEPLWKLWLAAFVSLMIWIKHQQNIRRLLNGTEKRFGEKEKLPSQNEV
ncbi:MAG: glycerol-3-phosphate 1-O-acyltransferase PlsY [Candidatus Electronema sp. V4]|uniref:glycerol-3-phosphate 1-O-acyltransferase PlsY n=1 Tax=Candidatus Electronema sp. V4 TaxID=3454756 RepID=UPI004055603F